MAIDHSLSYKKNKFKNLPHQFRLKKIIATLDEMVKPHDTYVDVGCSNGYITNIITQYFVVDTPKGLDYTVENLHKAEENYPHISFQQLDLNYKLPDSLKSSYDVITCFETLEHVGDLRNAVDNIIQLGKAYGNILITVPIEIGFWGIVKFLLKRFLYKGYSLEELGNVSTQAYFSTLIKGGNISVYRDSNKSGWGTHFGFDYRSIDALLHGKGLNFKAKSYFTTRFYKIKLS